MCLQNFDLPFLAKTIHTHDVLLVMLGPVAAAAAATAATTEFVLCL